MLLVTQRILDNTCRYKNSGKKVCFEIGLREKSMFFRQKLREKGPVLGKTQGKKFFILCRHPVIIHQRYVLKRHIVKQQNKQRKNKSRTPFYKYASCFLVRMQQNSNREHWVLLHQFCESNILQPCVVEKQ